MSDHVITIDEDPRVPKGTKFNVDIPDKMLDDDDFIHQLVESQISEHVHQEAQNKENIKANLGINDPNLSTRVASRIAATEPKAGDTGFLEGVKRGAMGMINPILHPTSMIPPQYSSMAAADKASNPEAEMQANPISRAASSDISGLVGEVLPAAAVASLGSPKVRATLGGAAKGAMGAVDPTGLRGKLSLIGAGGGGYYLGKVGEVLGGHPGQTIGTLVGAALPASVGAIKGAIQGFRSAPWLPPLPPEVSQAHFVYPDEADFAHMQGGARTTQEGPMNPMEYRTTSGKTYMNPEWSVDTEYRRRPTNTQPFNAHPIQDMPPLPEDMLPPGNIRTIGPGGYSPEATNIPAFDPSQYPGKPQLQLPPGVGSRSGQAIPLAPTERQVGTGRFQSGQMRDVRRNFYQAPDTPDTTKSPAPNDLHPVTPSKEQFKAKPKEEPKAEPIKVESKKYKPKDVVAQVDKNIKAKESEAKSEPKNTITSPETSPDETKSQFSRADIAALADNLGVTQTALARHLINSGYDVEASKFGDNWGLNRSSKSMFNFDDPKYKKQLEATTKKYKKKGS